MPPGLIFGVKDYVIAGLIAFIIFLFASIYIDLSFPLFGHRVGYEGWAPALARVEKEKAKIVKDGKDLKAKEEARTAATAKDADHEHEVKTLVVHDVTTRFIESNRVCPTGTNNDRGAESDSSRVPETMPASSLVAVSDLDVQRSSDAATYAMSCHNWAVETFLVKP